MKTAKKIVLWTLLCLFMASPSALAYTETFTTGKEWEEKMTPKEKLMSVLVPMILFHRYGVPFEKKAEQYVLTIDKVLLYNPYLQNEDVANIFASAVYAYEPESRPAFNSLLIETRSRKEGFKPEFFPRVFLKPSDNK